MKACQMLTPGGMGVKGKSSKVALHDFASSSNALTADCLFD